MHEHNLLPLVLLPDIRLRKKAQKVTDINDDLIQTLKNMHHTMLTAKGIGIAAPQVADTRQIIVVDLQDREENPDSSRPLFFINPSITWKSDTYDEVEEGCLSIPQQLATVKRPVSIGLEYTDINGNAHTLEASGLFARCLQHEIDHLNGVLFIDHLSQLKRNVIARKSKTIKKELIKEDKNIIPIAT
jgi:peptide deformylase